MSEDKLRTIKKIKEEIERVGKMIEEDQSLFGKGKLSGLYFALGKKLNFDGEVMEDEWRFFLFYIFWKMKIYADWGRTKDWFYIIDNNEIIGSSSFESLLNLVNNNTEVFLETGIPKTEFLIPLLKKGVTINLIKADKIKEKREKESIEKTDENDCLVIRNFIDDNGRVSTTLRSLEDLKNLKFKFFAKKHEQLNKTIVRLKNIESAYLSEYGESKDNFILILEKEKISVEKILERIFRIEIALFDDIKGIGTVTVAKALLFSNPKNFPNVSKYFAYVGFKDSVSKTKNGKRRVNPKRTPFYQMCDGVIMKKDKKWYPLYLKIKEKLKLKFPEDKPFIIDSKAKNRISTLLVKEFYKRIDNQKIYQKKID